jgi:hypothetical protein
MCLPALPTRPTRQGAVCQSRHVPGAKRAAAVTAVTVTTAAQLVRERLRIMWGRPSCSTCPSLALGWPQAA